MQTYGIIFVDWNGESNIFGPQVNPSSDGSDPWNENDISVLYGIPITDFDVMKLGTIH
jgi:hypothetical protein